MNDAKREMFSYRGSAQEQNYFHSDTWRWDRPGWVKCKGLIVRLAVGVYDLRASTAYLAKLNGAVYSAGFVTSSFQAAFSRAVKSLMSRRMLDAPSLVPLAEYDDDYADHSLIHILADGAYLMMERRQVRFVVKS
jgi:hypothetical protein